MTVILSKAFTPPPDITQKSPKIQTPQTNEKILNKISQLTRFTATSHLHYVHIRGNSFPQYNNNLSRRYMYSIDAFGSWLNIQHFKDVVLSILHILHIADDRIRQSEKLAKGV